MLGDSLFAKSNRKNKYGVLVRASPMNHSLSDLDLFLRTQVCGVSSSILSVLSESVWSLGHCLFFGGLLGILVVLSEMRGGWRFHFASLEACFRRRGEDLSLGGIFSFVIESPPTSSRVSRQWDEQPFSGHSQEEVSSEFEGVAGCSGMMEGQIEIICIFFKKM